MFVSFLFGASIASAISGYILKALDYHNFFILVIALYVLCIYQTFVFVKDEKPKNEINENSLNNLAMMKNIFQSRPNNVVIWTMLLSVVIIASEVSGK